MIEEKICLYCCEPLVRKPTEKPYNWASRNYCDKTCSGLHAAEKRRRKR